MDRMYYVIADTVIEGILILHSHFFLRSSQTRRRILSLGNRYNTPTVKQLSYDHHLLVYTSHTGCNTGSFSGGPYLPSRSITEVSLSTGACARPVTGGINIHRGPCLWHLPYRDCRSWAFPPRFPELCGRISFTLRFKVSPP
jgi:hypothetical protein